MGSQSVLPNLLPVRASEWEKLQQGPPTQALYGELQCGDTPNLTILTKAVGSRKRDISPEDVDHRQTPLYPEPTLRLCLFKLSMPANAPLEALLHLSKPRVQESAEVGLFAAYKVAGKQTLEYRYSEIPHHMPRDSHRMSLDYQGDGTRLVEFGVYCGRLVEVFQPLHLLRIEKLAISPSQRSLGRDFAIYDIHVMQRGKGPNAERRLAWRWQGADDQWPKWMPWSKTTGPFSYFTISMQGREVGKTYCLEFPIHTKDLEGSEATNEDIEIRISGLLFGGEEIMSLPVMIPMSDVTSKQESTQMTDDAFQG